MQRTYWKKLAIIKVAILISAVACRSEFRKVESGRKVMIEKCYACHAPGIWYKATPQDEMIPKYGREGFRQYLINQFKMESDKIEEHDDVTLTRAEINRVINFLNSFEVN